MNELIQKQPSSREITTNSNRVWEVDFLRGLLIICVMIDHFFSSVARELTYYNTSFWQTFGQFCDNVWGNVNTIGQFRSIVQYPGVMVFVLLSGVSCSFSKNNLKRGIRMAIFALIETLATWIVSLIFQHNYLIGFNIIHVLASCVLIWSLLDYLLSKCQTDCARNVWGVAVALLTVVCLIVGYYFLKYSGTHEWYWFIVQSSYSGTHSPSDFVSLTPALGWFLVGVTLGKFLYKEKKTLFSTFNSKWVSPITFCGRYSLWFYLGSQVLYTSVLTLFAEVFKVM